MKTTPTKRSAKAKKLWAYPYEDGDVVTDVPPSKHDVKRGFCRPVFLLPAAPDDVERMVEAGAAASRKAEHENPKYFSHEMAATAILAALGISTPAKKTKAL